MLAGATPREAALLRRLVNQEIAHYARYAMKYPGRTAIRLGDLYLPEGAGTAALLLAAQMIPASLRQSGPALRTRLRARACSRSASSVPCLLAGGSSLRGCSSPADGCRRPTSSRLSFPCSGWR